MPSDMAGPTMSGMPALPLMPEDFESVLCVVAHPDDLEYGTAAAVAKWTQAGKTVTYFLLTRGEAGLDTMPPSQAGPLREAEQREAGRRVGVDVVDFGAHPDGVIEYGPRLRRDIAREIRRRRPDLVVAGTWDERFPGGQRNQPDHIAVGRATMDAVADAGNRWIFPELTVEGLAPWHVRRVAIVNSLNPTHAVDVAGYLDAAVASLEAHAEYNAALPAEYPKPRQLLEMILGPTGQSTGLELALQVEYVER